MSRLDELDVKILDVLQDDATIALTDLAERVGSSKSVCWRRIQQYVESGLIRSRVAILDPKKVGLSVTIFAQVKIERHGDTDLSKFTKAIKRFPEIVECHTLTGSVDFLLKIMLKDIEEFEHFFFHKLVKVENVREVNSAISVATNVETTKLPISCSST